MDGLYSILKKSALLGAMAITIGATLQYAAGSDKSFADYLGVPEHIQEYQEGLEAAAAEGLPEFNVIRLGMESAMYMVVSKDLREIDALAETHDLEPKLPDELYPFAFVYSDNSERLDKIAQEYDTNENQLLTPDETMVFTQTDGVLDL